MNIKKPVYKAYPMEEFIDIIFFHPLGFKVAKAAFKFKLTPNHITYISMLFAIAGGLMLATKSTAYGGFGLLVISSILDSADGQLARMTKKGTLKGRILDGLIGYFMFTSSYIGLSILYLSTPNNMGLKFIIPLAVTGGAVSAFQSSMYDFYRTSFYCITVKKQLENYERKPDLSGFFKFIYSGYFAYQKLFAKNHINLIKKMRTIYPDGRIDENISKKYGDSNLKIIRGWNILGDNTRFLFILTAIILYKPHWYFIAILGPLNIIMIYLIIRQKYMDRKLWESVRGNDK